MVWRIILRSTLNKRLLPDLDSRDKIERDGLRRYGFEVIAATSRDLSNMLVGSADRGGRVTLGAPLVSANTEVDTERTLSRHLLTLLSGVPTPHRDVKVPRVASGAALLECIRTIAWYVRGICGPSQRESIQQDLIVMIVSLLIVKLHLYIYTAPLLIIH